MTTSSTTPPTPADKRHTDIDSLIMRIARLSTEARPLVQELEKRGKTPDSRAAAKKCAATLAATAGACLALAGARAAEFGLFDA